MRSALIKLGTVAGVGVLVALVGADPASASTTVEHLGRAFGRA